MPRRTPGNIRAVRPLRDAVIATSTPADMMIKTFIRKGNEVAHRGAPGW